MPSLSSLFQKKAQAQVIPTIQLSTQRLSQPHITSLQYRSSQSKIKPLETYSFPQKSTSIVRPLKSNKQDDKLVLKNQALELEIQDFKQNQREDVFLKIFIVVLPLLLITIFGKLAKIYFFELTMYTITKMLADFKIKTNKIMLISLQAASVTAYIALIYDILCKKASGTSDYYLPFADASILIMSLFAGLNYVIFTNINKLNHSPLSKGIHHISIYDNIKTFGQSYMDRLRTVVRFYQYIVLINCVVAALFSITCLLTQNHGLVVSLSFVMFIKTILIFMALDFFVFAIYYLQTQIQFFSFTKMYCQFPVCVALLRLSVSQDNQMIQKKCVQHIIKLLRKNGDYLQTESKSNYAINNYRDVFQLFAKNKLQLLLPQLSLLSSSINKNNLLICQKKLLSKDLFNPLHRVLALIHNDWLHFLILSKIFHLTPILQVLLKLSRNYQLKQQTIGCINQLAYQVGRLNMGKNKQGNRCIFGTFTEELRKYQQEINQFNSAIKGNADSTGTGSISAQNQNGWAYYKPAVSNIYSA